ncbi:hypothetical protein, partial [Cronobacter sakazakii]|uniref:hypothetical protein n=1 Tax=Cronobacter sakazakii TaxID=28141 RepID=UPI001F509397
GEAKECRVVSHHSDNGKLSENAGREDEEKMEISRGNARFFDSEIFTSQHKNVLIYAFHLLLIANAERPCNNSSQALSPLSSAPVPLPVGKISVNL